MQKIRTLIINFFIIIHRAFTDPFFYGEILRYKKLNLAFFLTLMLLISSLVLSLAHFNRFNDKEQGFASALSNSFNGISISNGKLFSKNGESFDISSLYLKDVVRNIFDIKSQFELDQKDSLIIINNSSEYFADTASRIFMAFNKDHIFINYGILKGAVINYKDIITPADAEITFTFEAIHSFIMSNSAGILFYFFLGHFFSIIFELIPSILFLSTAAFVFKRDLELKYMSFMKLSVFASLPLVLEKIITSIAGYSPVYTWHIAVFISTIILFRQLNAYRADLMKAKKKKILF